MFGRLIRMLTHDTINGYEHPDVVEVVFQKTVAYQPTEAWPEIIGSSTVLDFGGGCGRHYKEAAISAPDVRWAIVETPTMVGRAKELETDNLRFFANIPAAASWLGQIDVMHSNGAIQFAPNPTSTVRQLCGLNARKMLWHRINFSDSAECKTQISRLADHGPQKLRGVRNANVATTYSQIREEEFMAAHTGYGLTGRGEDWFRFSLA